MSRTRTRLRLVTIAAAAAVVAGLGAVTFNASAAENSADASAAGASAAGASAAGAEFRSRGIPAAIRPPAGSRFIGYAAVTSGTQTYTCTGGVFTGASVPEAQLSGSVGQIHHYKGPTWEQKRDGSIITAAKIGESAVTGAIPQLLLQVNGHSGNTGILTKANYIQRLRTTGGTAPAGACTDGATKAVKYGAIYVFWA
ncbi:DUF3455 domain-containing protein [Actinoplanes sp. NPDC089786]|uniref:DUF3455 domain-containing protein n=1 Tax=Actinoplanes sp. NPDC089786 TaxID=3155185 RepID=UPI0034431677